jgi:hypothetical protein
MAELQIVTTLRAKRDELERIIGSYEKAIEAARRDLAHVNATLQLFERDGIPNAYPSRMSLIRVFRRGEIFAICKIALARTPAGMDTRELALAVLTAKGMDTQDAVLRKAVAYSIINVMRQQFRRGNVADVSIKTSKPWTTHNVQRGGIFYCGGDGSGWRAHRRAHYPRSAHE